MMKSWKIFMTVDREKKKRKYPRPGYAQGNSMRKHKLHS